VRAAVVDPHQDLTAGPGVAYTELGAEGERGVGGGLVVHVVALAAGRPVAVELRAVPGGHPSRERQPHRGGRRGLVIGGAASQQQEGEEGRSEGELRNDANELCVRPSAHGLGFSVRWL